MPRTARIALANFPHHLVQRGHNRRDVFRNAADRVAYLETLIQFRAELKFAIYGYCLMTNHVHLIVNPGEDPENLGRLMKRLAGRHTRRINYFEERSGTLWGGRYKCSPIETDRYLLACLRYVDLNPVRAGITARPEQFVWSSYRARAGLEECAWLDRDPATEALGNDEQRRCERYREFVAQGDDELELLFIRESLQRGRLTASKLLTEKMERSMNVQLPQLLRGRPRNPR